MLRFVCGSSPRFRSRRRVRRATSAWLILAILATHATPWHPAAAVRAADVTITGTTVGGPQLGQGGVFTVTTTGTISSGGEGVVADPANGITQLFVEGVVDAVSQGFNNNAGSGVLTASVNGRVSGGIHGVLNSGTIGQVAINFGEVSSSGGTGLRNSGSMQLLQVGAPGSIIGGGSNGVTNDAGAAIQFLQTGGTISGVSGIATSGTIGQLFAFTDAAIAGTDHGIRVNAGGGIGLVSTAGSITGFNGFSSAGSVGSLINYAPGTIQGSSIGLRLDTGGAVTALDNAGMIVGNGDFGMLADPGVTIGTLTNSGTITGSNGIGSTAVTGTIRNQAGGLIEGTGNRGVLFGEQANVELLDNTGSLAGATAGVQVTTGTIGTLTNSGTIAFTGAGTGPAVLVGPGGVLGVASGSSGVALSSTGAGALLDGTIVNQGTIHHGFTIENQSVTVSADGGTGTFTGGTLDVVDGDLTFTGGRTNLTANVSVEGGVGTVFNEAVLAVLGPQSVAGNFVQTSGGSTSSIITDASTFGSLAISGTAEFGGTLDLDLAGAFALAEGQVFNLFSFASYTGGFSGLSVDGVSLASFGANAWLYGGLVLEETWSANSMSVSIAPVPEPSTFALGAAGIACAAWLRHRRRAAARRA